MSKTRREKPMMHLAGPGKRRASLVAVALTLTDVEASAADLSLLQLARVPESVRVASMANLDGVVVGDRPF